MRIGVVGGVERLEARLTEVGRRVGHTLEFHDGHMSSTASGRLAALVERSDLVVIITSVNSHNAVIQARNLARERGRPICLVRRLGPSQLRALAGALPLAEGASALAS